MMGREEVCGGRRTGTVCIQINDEASLVGS